MKFRPQGAHGSHAWAPKDVRLRASLRSSPNTKRIKKNHIPHITLNKEFLLLIIIIIVFLIVFWGGFVSNW